MPPLQSCSGGNSLDPSAFPEVRHRRQIHSLPHPHHCRYAHRQKSTHCFCHQCPVTLGSGVAARRGATRQTESGERTRPSTDKPHDCFSCLTLNAEATGTEVPEPASKLPSAHRCLPETKPRPQPLPVCDGLHVRLLWMRNPRAVKVKATLSVGFQTDPGPPDPAGWVCGEFLGPASPKEDACGV